MGDRLKGKVAIVTGSGQGIGRGEALALALEGAKVVVNDLGCDKGGSGASRSRADGVVAEIKKMGGEAVANYDSVATWKCAESIIKTAVDAFGRLDILVNNAGIYHSNEVIEARKRVGLPDTSGRKPEDIGPLLVWLASDDAAYVTGRTFFVTTGRIAIFSEPIQEKALLKDGGWTVDELFKFMPTSLAADLSDVNVHT